MWNSIGTGDVLHAGLEYSMGLSFDSSPIKTAFASSLVNDQLIIGGLSEAEATRGSESSLDLNFNVEYEIPAQLINLTVRNDLYGADGGYIGMAVYPNTAVSRPSPFPFTAYEENRLNLEAYDNQYINDKEWFFNDSEYPDERSEWRKEKDEENTYISSNQSFTTSALTTNDSEAIFVAYLKTTTYTTSGTMPSNERWFISPVTLTGDVTVPSGVTLEIQSGVSVSLNGNNIISTGGTITVDSGATINSSNSHTRLITGSAIKGIYSTIASAMSAATSGQSIEVYGSHTLAANLTVPPGVTLTFKNGSDITLDSHTIQKGSGSLAIESGASFTPDIRLMSGSTVLGLYTSLDAAYGDGSDVEIRGTHTFADYYTVSSGRILRAESGSELRFPPGKYLNVYGTLHGNQADFTSTSGTWGGIRYRSAGSGTLDHCTMSHATYGIRSTSTSTSLHFTHNTISGCSYGIYCSSSSPEIRDNAVSNCSSYGVYLYNSSAELESNRISGSKVYLNNSDASLENNLITGAYGNEAVYFYASSPELYYNTISTTDALWAVYANNGSDPLFGQYENYTYTGFNYMSSGESSEGVILASNASTPVMGGHIPQVWGNCKNSIIWQGTYYAAVASDGTSSIDARRCWWGQPSASACYGDVLTTYPLQSDPGSGSTLSKSSPEPVMASHPEEEPGDEAAKALWEAAMGAVWEKNYTGALDDFQTLIRLYPASTYAYRALSMSVRLCREQKPRDMLTYLDELLTGVEDKTLRAVIKSRKVSEYRRMKDTKQAIALSREILAENPETIHETTALFDLFNLYDKDLADSVQAEYYLTELKTKYPEDELTGIARIDWGEDPEKVVIRKRTLPGQEEEILPEVFILGSAYPNPFNPVTRLTYSLPDAGDLVFEVVDITGRIVDRITFSNHPAGEHHFDYTASHLSTGLYIVRARYNRQVQIRKIVYMK
ncbi:right-handed parallel beta-helix repeat-containing protein [Fidelibacter multiformis]|uniref:right-handed parallel beta-helix repeat-containing protein n=1 Tax=Fidelibacter multiformis TaxID=3377529 RepID=UPI0037DDB943